MASNPGPRLSKEINSIDYLSIGFGSMIGVGWIIVLGEWLAQAGPLGAILAFVCGGLVTMLVGLCYAELATLLPVSGGEVAYAYEIFGLRTSFAVGWVLSLPYVAVTAWEAIAVAWIANIFVPGIEGPVLYSIRGHSVHLGSLVLGVVLMVAFTYVNFRGAKGAARVQGILTLGLVVITALYVVLGVGGGDAANLKPLFGNHSGSAAWLGFLAILMTVPQWLGGFNMIPQLMEEKAPGTSLRLVGRLIVISIAMGVVFYCLVILAACMVVPWEELLTAEMPVAAAFEAAFGSPLLAKGVLLAGLCGLLTTWNGCFIGGSRVLFALGRSRVIAPAFGRVHPVFHTPSTAILFVGGVGIFGALVGKSALVPVLNVNATCFLFAYLLSCVGVIKLRRERPDTERPFRIPGGIILPVVASVACLILLIPVTFYQPYVASQGAFPIEWGFLMVWAFLGVLFWFLSRKVRGSISEEQRRDIMLGKGDPAL